ncbi:MAG TPA: hypothetical protein PLQ97_11650 [Myxococcota bacterium]|nr:hypothetical protein [Myxococcota bacterium]HQK51738.1 hypothetical protein [Myxococcota bacterium]
MERRESCFLVALACSLAWGCGGGWFVLSDKVASPPPDVVREGGYLTGSVDVQNREVLLSPEYTAHRGRKVKYLLITAQYVPPGVTAAEASKEPEIPVLLLDARTQDAQMEQPHDLDVISRYPLHGRKGGLGRMAFRVRVLREDAGNTVLKVWEALTAAGGIADLDPTGYLSLANRLMDVIRPFLAEGSRTLMTSFQVDQVGDSEMAAAWVLLPTDEQGRVARRVAARWEEVRRSLSICGDDQRLWLCRGDGRLEGFPYLIVRYRRDDYRSDPDLPSRKWRDAIPAPGACPAPADVGDWVFKAWAALNRDVWSPQQREVEWALLRGNLGCLSLLQGPLPETGALGLYVQCHESLPARLSPDHPLAPYLEEAMSNLEACVRSRAAQIDGYDAFAAMVEVAAEVRAARLSGADPRRLPLPELKAQLRRTAETLRRVKGLGVDRARATREVATWREELEKALYLREFEPKVEALATADEPAPALAQELDRALSALASEQVECDRCREEVRRARCLAGVIDVVAKVPEALEHLRHAAGDVAARQAIVHDLQRMRDGLAEQHDRGVCDMEGTRALAARVAEAMAMTVPLPTPGAPAESVAR